MKKIQMKVFPALVISALLGVGYCSGMDKLLVEIPAVKKQFTISVDTSLYTNAFWTTLDSKIEVPEDYKIFVNGRGLYSKRKYEDALRVLEPFAKKGDAEAQYYVGDILLSYSQNDDLMRIGAKYLVISATKGNHGECMDVLNMTYKCFPKQSDTFEDLVEKIFKKEKALRIDNADCDDEY